MVKLSDDKNILEKCFCITNSEYINLQNNKLENYFMYSTDFQLNLFTNFKYIFIYDIFKSVTNIFFNY